VDFHNFKASGAYYCIENVQFQHILAELLMI